MHPQLADLGVAIARQRNLLTRFDGHELVLSVSHWQPDGTARHAHIQVQVGDRRGLGHPEALVDIHAEALLDGLREAGIQRRRARKYGPQAAQVEFLDLRVLRQQHRDGRCDESEGHAETFVGGEEATQLETRLGHQRGALL